MNIPILLTFGYPKVGLTWPKDAVIKTEVVKNADGRYEATVHMNDQVYRMLGTFPTELDAQITLDVYVEESRAK